jgi:hypothetical protein
MIRCFPFKMSSEMFQDSVEIFCPGGREEVDEKFV